jgi:GntR family transcriptional regulator/MocR family aminotransferase
VPGVLEIAFRPDRAAAEPLYGQLHRHLRGLIETGRLAPGEKLPPTRELARSLGLGRKTVAQAYEALASDGLVTAHVGQGSFVAARGPSAVRPEPATGARAFAWDGLLAARTRRLRLSEGFVQPGAIRFDFRPGGVDVDTAPELALKRAFSRALARHGRALAAHRDPLGWPPLREAIARALVARGIATRAEEVMVTNGAQHALDLIARCLVDPGDTVAIEQPGYFAASLAFAASGAHLLGVPVDERGLRTDALARALRARRVKLVYATPAVQSPTGVVLDEARRRELLALADEHQTPIVEDDYDSELRLGGPPVAALKNRDTMQQVLYIGTFSKATLPGVRIGYLVAPPALLERFLAMRFAGDFGSGAITQAALAELLTAGDLERHVRRVRKLYASRLAALDAALGEAMPEGAHWRPPAGGSALWLTLPRDLDADAVWAETLRAGLAMVRGDAFFFDGRGRDHLLLGVSGLEASAIAEGTARLGEIVRRVARRRPGRTRRSAA